MTGADVRAALIAGVLLFYGVVAVPAPRTVSARTFENPVAVEEIARWTEILAAVGLPLTGDELTDRVVTVGNVFGKAKAAIVDPARPFLRLTGTGQSWGLFTYPDTFPHKLVVEARAGHAWRVVYAGLDDDADFLRDVVTYRRIRGVYDGNTTSPGDSWNNFARWTADRVFEAFPDVTEVRVGFRRFHTTPPGGTPDPEVVPRLLRTFRRDAR